MSTSIGESLGFEPTTLRTTHSKHSTVNHSVTPARPSRYTFVLHRIAVWSTFFQVLNVLGVFENIWNFCAHFVLISLEISPLRVLSFTYPAITRVESHYSRIHQLLRRVYSHTPPFTFTGSHKHVTGSHKDALNLMLLLRLPFPPRRENSPARQNILNLLLRGVTVVTETWFP